MRQSFVVLCALTAVLAGGSQVLADWCHDFTDNVFCDDFDRYCTAPPAPWGTCDGVTTGGRSDGALRAVWNWSSYNWNTAELGGTNAQVEDATNVLETGIYGEKHANGGDEGGTLGQNTVDLAEYVASALPGYSAANGSDAEPLVLRFTISGGVQTANGIRYSNGYMELNLGDDTTGSVNNPTQAPTDWVQVGNDDGAGCQDCYHTCPSPNFSVHVAWPSICQSYEPRTSTPDPCPPLQTFIRSSIAVGALAMLDNNPCHCENPADQVPQNDHVSYFDGLMWRSIRSNMFPGNGGDFTWGDKFNTIVLTIKTSTVDLSHTGRFGTPGNYTWVTSTATGIPRQYTGAFDRLRAGTKEGCMLNNGSYTCDSSYANGKKRPTRMGDTRCDGGGWQTNKSKFISFDSVRLSGGVGGAAPTGACCKNDGTCVEAEQVTCEDPPINGHFQGTGTVCPPAAGAVTCCPYPFADADTDGDVDAEDFGTFQVCYSGNGVAAPSGCECFDREQDTDVDGVDYTEFNNCWSGPNVPWAPGGSCNP